MYRTLFICMFALAVILFPFSPIQANEPDSNGAGGETRVGETPAGETAPAETQQPAETPPTITPTPNLGTTPPAAIDPSRITPGADVRREFEGGLVPCDNIVGADGKIANPCDFNAFMALINKVIRFILFALAIPIAAIMFAYAGFLMVTSGGSTEARGKAKKIFTNAAYGLVIAATAWLIVRTILSILGYDGAWIGFPFILTP